MRGTTVIEAVAMGVEPRALLTFHGIMPPLPRDFRVDIEGHGDGIDGSYEVLSSRLRITSNAAELRVNVVVYEPPINRVTRPTDKKST